MTLVSTPTRGERNNNPGNIEWHADIHWLGQTGIETVPEGAGFRPRFARFSDPRYGIRALAKLLYNYMARDGLCSVRTIVGKWAPGTENDTAAYVQDVAGAMGVASTQPLPPTQPILAALTRQIIRHENGRVPYDDALIAAAVQAAMPLGNAV